QRAPQPHPQPKSGPTPQPQFAALDYLIDGSNVCGWVEKPNPRSLIPLLTLLQQLDQRGDSYYCFFDANIQRVFSEYGDTREAAICSQMLAKYPNRFAIMTGGTRADDS